MRTRKPLWTHAELVQLRRLNRVYRGDLKRLAFTLRREPWQIDHALWNLLGTTPCEAMDALNQRRAA